MMQSKLNLYLNIGSNQKSETIEKFKEEFIKIKKAGFVPSNRIHNTGIGKTFEDLIGVRENNTPSVDYNGLIELKSSRLLSQSMITLFTKSPTYPVGANTYLRVKYGYADPRHPTQNILHTTVSATSFNTCNGRYGFNLEIVEADERIYLRVKDISQNEIIDDIIYYSYDSLKEIVDEKCNIIAYIKAENKIENDREYFKFISATLLSGLTFEKFIKLVKEGIITYDIRIGTYKTGKSKGKTHDHGSGFRILKKNLSHAFEMHEI